MSSSEIVIVYATDFHYTRMNPRSRKDDFGRAILDKLSSLVSIGNRLGADAVAMGGDLFDRKGQVTIEETREVAQVLRKADVPVVSIMGNHDQIGYRLDSLPRTGYGLLVAAGLIRHLDDEPLIVCRDDLRVCVTGASYQDGVDRGDREAYFPQRSECDFQVHLTHGYLLDAKDSIIEEFTPYTRVAGTEADCLLNGHYHPEQKSKKVKNARGGSCMIVCPGAASRGALTSDNFDRMPKMVVLRITRDGIRLGFGRFPTARPAAEVLKFEEKKEKRERDDRLKSFAESLREEAEKADTGYTPEELVAAVGDDMPELDDGVTREEVVIRVKRYLEMAGVGQEG